MDFIKSLREEFAKVQNEAQDVISAAAKENRELSAEEKEANDKRFARMETIRGIVQEQLRFAKLALEEGNVELPKAPEGRDEYEKNAQISVAGNGGKFDLDAYRDALNHYARTGEKRRELFTVTTGTGSGAYLPKQVLAPSTVRRLQNAYRGVLAAYGVSPIETDSLAAFSLPVADDTSNTGQSQSESANSGTELDPTDASISISPTLYSSKQFWYSNTMVLAQSFDVLGYTVPMALKRIDKIQESAWTTTIKIGTVGKRGASTTGFTYSEILDWEHSLAPAYRSDAAFVVSDGLYRVLRGIVDDQHRPIFDQDPTNVFQGKMHGKPVIVCDYLDAVTANKKVGAFCSAEALKIVDVSNTRIVRYTNVPSKPDQIGFEVFTNGDFNFISSGVALLATAVS